MALKAIVKSLNDIPEQFHSLYTQIGDEFVLDIDDTEYKQKIGEFRNNNIDLSKQLKSSGEMQEQLKAAQERLALFENVDPEKAREALETIQNLEDQKLIDAGKMDELLAQRTERMRQDLQAQTDAALSARDEAIAKEQAARDRLSNVVIDSSLQTAVTGVATVRAGAMRDILGRGKDVWKLDDNGNPIPHKPDGTVMYGKDGENPVSMEEWAQGLLHEAPYLFEGNAGGGAGGNLDGSGDNSVVLASDTVAMGNNLEGIAAGNVKVSQT